MLWIVLSLACVHTAEVSTPQPEASSRTQPIPSHANPETTTTSEDQNGVGLQPDTEVSLDSINECIEICVQQNQMRAVSADMIEADCRASCSGKLQPLGTTPLTPFSDPP